jgi:hypothetical protein
VSEKLRTIFDEFNVPAEYFPLQVTHRKKKYDQVAYFLFNPLDFPDVLDYEKSDYQF